MSESTWSGGEPSEAQVDEDLDLDLRVYGCCYWKRVDGKKVRVHPHDIRYIKGVPRDSTNTACSSGEIISVGRPSH